MLPSGKICLINEIVRLVELFWDVVYLTCRLIYTENSKPIQIKSPKRPFFTNKYPSLFKLNKKGNIRFVT